MVRRALTRQTRWYQNRCSIDNIKVLSSKNRFGKFSNFNPWWPQFWPEPKNDRNDFEIIFRELSNAVFCFVLRHAGAEIDGGVQIPPAGRGKSRGPSGRGLRNQTTMLSHRECIVTLIPKQGKPKDSIKGWRPISLLNVDFKIMSSAFTNIIKTVINDLISPTQTAYIPERFIGENSRIMYDTIQHVNSISSTGIIMAVDFEASFDTVSWEFLTEALHHYNFGPNCIQTIKTMYLNSDNFSRILLDGFLGQTIKMERGIRQGDPDSGLLFNLVMEPLTNQILEANDIKGIPLSNNPPPPGGVVSDPPPSVFPESLLHLLLYRHETWHTSPGINLASSRAKKIKIDRNFFAIVRILWRHFPRFWADKR